jgi:hypothetical protein
LFSTCALAVVEAETFQRAALLKSSAIIKVPIPGSGSRVGGGLVKLKDVAVRVAGNQAMVAVSVAGSSVPAGCAVGVSPEQLDSTTLSARLAIRANVEECRGVGCLEVKIIRLQKKLALWHVEAENNQGGSFKVNPLPGYYRREW